MNTHKVSLEEILDAREFRSERIKQLTTEYPNHSHISFKLNIPGPIKNNDDYHYAFNAGIKEVIDVAKVIYNLDTLKTGPEAFLISNLSPEDLKLAMIEIEDKHPLGRLFDLDVDGSDRSMLGVACRKCLICDNLAHACGRSRTHDLDEIITKIDMMIKTYREVNNED